MREPVFKTAAGTFRGRICDACIQITGIRYASSERFGPPEAYRYPEGVHDCLAPSPACVQRASWFETFLMKGSNAAYEQAESCQYLSITMPREKTDQQMPVMVYFHGGSYRNGGCDSANYDRRYLAGEQKVIVVGVNYRLNILGFVRDQKGNAGHPGLLDAIEALRWIRRNIASFGGDSECVTIFGQSSGADLVRCIMLSEGTDHLYRRAVIQSDPFGAMQERREMERQILAKASTLPEDADYDAVRAMIADIETNIKVKGNAKYLMFAPHYGVSPLPEEADFEKRLAGIAKDHELLIGTASREVSVYGGGMKFLHVLDRFILTRFIIEAMIRRLSEGIFVNGAKDFARMYHRCGGTAYFYTFFWKDREYYLAGGHAMDLPLLFGGDAIEGSPSALGMSAGEIGEAGRPMRAIWAEFARTGVIEENGIPGMLEIGKTE